MIPNALPPGLLDNPRLDQWVTIEADRTVAMRTGKVEIGQGILTALRQIAADELYLDLDQLKVVSGDTEASPEEGFTAGSFSVELGGGALRLACAEVRGLLVAAAAEKLGAPPEALAVEAGRVLRDGAATDLDYWNLAGTVDLALPATGAVPTKRAAEYRHVGEARPRLDLPAKVFGGGFVHDLAFPDMLHARVLHRPWPGARLATPDAELRRLARDGVEVLREGDFAAFVSPDEAACAAAMIRALERVAWEGGTPPEDADAEPAALSTRPTIDRVIGPADAVATPGTAQRLRATYSRPFQAHASIGTCCAVARFDGDRLEVWTHSQGVGPLRGALATVFGLPAEAVAVRHRQGAGCYGHNGADDAALDAALVARRYPGRPVRVLWLREDELTAAPVSAAMTVTLEAGLDDAGRPLDWSVEIVSPSHNTRPGIGGKPNLAAAEALPEPFGRCTDIDVPDARGGGGVRNALALYDLPPQRILHRLVPDLPVRTSALRGLGALANVFAIESFVDELALAAGRDPVAYRLGMLSDPRARRVIERVAAMAGWDAEAEPATGAGRGIAFSRYKNRAGYAALVAEVVVEETVRVTRVFAAVDAGLVVNPDGARNQVEGGIVQAASLALKEQVRFAGGRIATSTWETYEILRFSEVPEVEVALVGDAADPPLGLGEVAAGPAAAAIGNAVAHALGVRVRDLPLTRDRVMAAMA